MVTTFIFDGMTVKTGNGHKRRWCHATQKWRPQLRSVLYDYEYSKTMEKLK